MKQWDFFPVKLIEDKRKVWSCPANQCKYTTKLNKTFQSKFQRHMKKHPEVMDRFSKLLLTDMMESIRKHAAIIGMGWEA